MHSLFNAAGDKSAGTLDRVGADVGLALLVMDNIDCSLDQGGSITYPLAFGVV